MTDIKCPFCDEDGFDLVGLKSHLTGEGLIFSEGCQKYLETFTIQEETNLNGFRRGYLDGKNTATQEKAT